ncbi:MAG: CapA family protein [Chloroflexi bacterium]|nr:CapA family protein [Chloroflexota bacterium]MCI0576578.1 CapA family protein [Chloroflexota bacterium]MCI0649621.1 CapA family protein [Chloroflexota bacterium]
MGIIQGNGRNSHARWAAGWLFFWLLACTLTSTPAPTPTTRAKLTITPTPPHLYTPTPLQTTIPSPLHLSAAPGVPAELVEPFQALTKRHPRQFTWTTADPAGVTLAVGEGEPVATWIYAVAAPFPTLAGDISLAELQAAWQAGTLYLDEETAAALAAWWGKPAAPPTIVPAAALVERLWAGRPALAVVPFHRLVPELKVLRLGGRAPIDLDFDPAGYPLALPVGLRGPAGAVAQVLASWDGPATNRDDGRITHLAMTGPSGLGRAVGHRMETRGLTYPGEAVAPLLQAVDIAHMSNEVPFAPDCPYPEPVGGTSFCARDSYLELMTYMGIDVNEMTGNHVNDWGEPNLQHTLDLYEAAGIQFFGGGRELAGAQRPLLIEHNGNRLAFTGCNPVGPYYAWAREEYGGSLPCDDYSFITGQISELAAGGYLVIATLQYLEHYQYEAWSRQQRDFKALAEAGAMAVSGSQGHHAQGFAFHQGSFIHFGLGNLIFDQMQFRGTRQTFIDVYLIYDGRLLNVDLWTGLIENYARPRPMTAEEREQLLAAVFEASGWPIH